MFFEDWRYIRALGAAGRAFRNRRFLNARPFDASVGKGASQALSAGTTKPLWPASFVLLLGAEALLTQFEHTYYLVQSLTHLSYLFGRSGALVYCCSRPFHALGDLHGLI